MGAMTLSKVHAHNRLCSKMAKDNNFARVLKMTLPPTIARKLVTLTPLRSVRYGKTSRIDFAGTLKKSSNQGTKRSCIGNQSFNVVLETAAILMPVCMKNDIQFGLTTAKNTQDRQHGSAPKDSFELRMACQENKDTFFTPIWCHFSIRHKS